MVKLRINGRDITATPGSTVLEAAQAYGIKIPSLCASKGLSSYGGCRLCLVEIKGKRGYLPACTTTVEEGLEVTTETPRLQALRRQTLELILSEHPHACLICTEKKDCEEYKSTIRKVGEVTGCVLCTENGRCELQDIVAEIKVDRVRWPATYREFEVHREDPFFDRNYNLCILCARCVRVCAEVRGAAAISVDFRGSQAVIGTALGRPLLESGCQFCGACVDICPTGALAERGLKGEGLPDESRETVCPLCSLGCALEVDRKGGRIVSSRPQREAEVNGGQACVKGRFVVRDTVHTAKRILQPMVRKKGQLVEVSWDEALDFAAAKLQEGAARESALIVSSQATLEDQYIAQLFARKIMGTQACVDFPGPSAPSFFRSELQKEKISLPLNFELNSLSEAETIVVAGADVSLSHPIVWLEILKAVRRGARLLVWNSAKSALDRWATSALRIEKGRELATLLYLSLRLLEQRPSEKNSSLPEGEDLKISLEGEGGADLSSSGGFDADELLSAVHVLKADRRAVFLVGPEMVQGRDAPRLVRALWNLALLCGARIIPLAAENNERGVVELWPSCASEQMTVSEPSGKGQSRALYLAGNPPGQGIETAPGFLVVQGCYQCAVTGMANVVFPAATWAETEGTFVSAEGRIQRFRRVIEPLGESRQDWWIFCRLAERMGNNEFPFKNPAEIAEEISRAIPSLHAVSNHHLKKGRPAFIVEEKNSPSAVRFVPLNPVEEEIDNPADTGTHFETTEVRDDYRGLNLREEVRGLRRLREKDGSRGREQEK